MLAVAAEQLVGAHAGQDHLDAALAGGLAHEQRVDRGRVAYRLVEHVDHARQQADDVRRDLDLVQVDAEPRRDLPRVDGVVGHGLQPLVFGPEGDGVGVDPLACLVRQHGDDARVQAAGQEARHRHVRDEVRRDRLLDHRAQVGGRAVRGLVRHVRDAPVVLRPRSCRQGRMRAHEPGGSFRTPSMAHC